MPLKTEPLNGNGVFGKWPPCTFTGQCLDTWAQGSRIEITLTLPALSCMSNPFKPYLPYSPLVPDSFFRSNFQFFSPYRLNRMGHQQ